MARHPLIKDKLLWATFALASLVTWLPHSQRFFALLFPQLERPVYRLEPFAYLLWQHVQLVCASSAVSIALGTAIGLWITRSGGRQFRPLAETIVALGQTFPPVAVLALAVPVLGFGELPALAALALYGLLPVVQGALAGVASVPGAVAESARGMGMSARQQLWQVELPLALPVWLAGVRTSVIINIGTAAIASTVGAKTLGSPIIVGLAGFNTAYVLQGALLVGMLALVTDLLFERLAARMAWQR